MSTEPGLQTLFHQAGKLRLLSPIEEVELARRRDAGDPDAVRKLVEHNLRLSIWRAKKWQGRGIPYEDLIQEGVFGLERAARKFDPTRGVKFSTYATTWIDHFMQRSISQDEFVPYIIRKRRQKAEDLKAKGLDTAQIADRLECKEVEVVEALESSSILASLDGDEAPLYERIAAPDGSDGEADVRVREAVALLPEDEAEFIRLRHGLAGNEPHTKTEVARTMGITSKDATALEVRAVTSLQAALGDYAAEPDMHPCTDLGPEEVDVVCSR